MICPYLSVFVCVCGGRERRKEMGRMMIKATRTNFTKERIMINGNNNNNSDNDNDDKSDNY